MKKHILQLSLLILISLTATFKASAQDWRLTGNAGTNPANNFVGTTDQQPLVFRTNGDERARILSSGKFGIGLKKPEAKLHVKGNDIVSLTSPGYLMLGDVATSNMAFDHNVIQARYNGTATSIYLNYYGGATYLGPSSAVSISTAGILTTTNRVGINGASNASYALTVNPNNSLGGINITDAGDNTVLNFSKSGLNYGAVFAKTSTSSGVETIRSTNAGSGSGIYAYSAAGIAVYGSTGGASYGVYGYTPGGSGARGVYGYSGGFGHGVSGYCENGSGVYGTSGTHYAGWFDGDVFCSGTYVGSDLKLKQNVKDVTKAMDIINQLRPKLYDFKTDASLKGMHLPKGSHYGLIAQDVEKVLPNIIRNSKYEEFDHEAAAVPSGKEDGSAQTSKTKKEVIDFKALNYTELIPIMIKGMQEQQLIIDKQQQQIDELKQLVQKAVASNSSAAKVAEVATGAYLIQNAPNPFSQNTTVKCYVPSSVKQAQLAIYNMSGQLLKSYKLSNGLNNVNVVAGSLASGQYTYSLLADGKKVDSKSMVMSK